MPMPRKPRKNCLHCGQETARSGYIYCSNVCQRKHEYVSYIANWKRREVTGLMSLGLVSRHIKKYLRDKFGNKCVLCGWSKINPKTKLVPLVADHIDGNWRNNTEGNLRLLCPNCDALNPTYAGLNRGNGRENRAVSKRAKDAHAFLAKMQPVRDSQIF